MMRFRSETLLLSAFSFGVSACGASVPEPVSPSKASAAKTTVATVTGKAKKPSKASAMSFEDELIARADEPSREKRARRGESRDRSRSITPFRLTDLPISVAPTPFPTKTAPTVVDGTSAIEIVTKKNDYGYNNYGYGYPQPRTFYNVRVSGQGFTSGALRIGATAGFFGTRNGSETGGINVACGKDEANLPAHWEGFVEKGGSPSYVLVEGWFDTKTCRAVDLQRVRIPLAEIVPNILYAFRQCEDATCSTKTSVGFVIPSALSVVMNGETRNVNQGPGTRVIVPVARGISQSILAGIEVGRGGVRELAVELVQSVSDAEPIATAFFDAAK